MPNIKINSGQVQKELDKANKKLNTGRKDLMHEVGRIGVQDTQHRIRTSKVDPEGQPWEPWALSTFLSRERQGTVAGGLLFNSGELFNSIQYKVEGNNHFVSIFSTAEYADYLQQGTFNMPARPFLGWSSDAQAKIDDAVERWWDKQ